MSAAIDLHLERLSPKSLACKFGPAIAKKRTCYAIRSPHWHGPREQKWSAHALRLYNHWHFGKLSKYSASAADRHPLVEKNLQGAPHRHPADNQHALPENIRSGVVVEGIRQFPQHHATQQEAQANEQRDTAVPEQQPKPAA